MCGYWIGLPDRSCDPSKGNRWLSSILITYYCYCTLPKWYQVQNMTLEWSGVAQNALVDATVPGYPPLVLGGLHTVLCQRARFHQLLKKQSSFHLQVGRS